MTITVFCSDNPIPATHIAHMATTEPAIAFPALCGDDICEIRYYQAILRTALAFEVLPGHEVYLPTFPTTPNDKLEGYLTVFDIEALPFAVEVAGNTGEIFLVPRSMTDMSGGLILARDRFDESKATEEAGDELERALSEILPTTPHELELEVLFVVRLLNRANPGFGHLSDRTKALEKLLPPA